MITAATFRANFPEFVSAANYPTVQIDYWAAIAYKMINADRWGDLTDTGAELYVAHNIVLEARAVAEAGAGAIPGGTTGPIASKSVDRVSIGYDVGSGTEEGGGHWNLTIYGTRYLRMAKMMGAGPVHVGTGNSSGGFWPGPLM